jgi:hypothetical protein
VNAGDLIFPIASLRGGQLETFLGNAFPVTPSGGLLTCRHVAPQVDANGDAVELAVLDVGAGRWNAVETVLYPDDESLDLAFIPGAIRRTGVEQLTLLKPSEASLGEEVKAFGYILDEGFGGEQPLDVLAQVGHIVSVRPRGSRVMKSGYPSWGLSFPVVEGLSGSPLVTDHGRLLLIGLCYGSEQQRIAAHEATVVEGSGTTLREEIHRIIEFGLAFQVTVLEAFLQSVAAGEYMVSDRARA